MPSLYKEEIKSKIDRWLDIINLGYLLFRRDFQYRFRLTYFGYVWAFVRPLLGVVPLIIIGKQFKFAEGASVNYEMFSFIGFILLQIFWDAVVIPQWFIRRIRRIVKNIFFPYEAIIIASLFYILFYLSIYIVEIFIGFFIFKLHFSFKVLLGLFLLFLFIIAGLSIGIAIAPLIFIYLDFRYSLPFFYNILLWLTPVVYASPKKGLLFFINKINPLTYLLNTTRSLFLNADVSIFSYFFAGTVFFVFLFIASLKFYYYAISIAKEQIL